LVWNELTEGFATALRAIGLYTPERIARLELAVPRDPSHGDWSTNLALALAKEAKRPPRAIAEALAAAYPSDPQRFDPVEVAGPGFLNVRYSRTFLTGLPSRIRELRERFGHSSSGAGARVLVEYVSANPTGPLNVVSARAAAVGSALIRLLNAIGFQADGEFYVNDVGRQADLLALSVQARARELAGQDVAFPADGYQGAYVKDLARALGSLAAGEDAAAIRERAIQWILELQRHDLGDYGAEFSRWFRESELHGAGAVTDTLRELEARGMTYRARKPEGASDRPAEGDEEAAPLGDATYLRTSRFGDDIDRVVVRSDGTPTYLLPDIAYHRDKRSRGYRYAINLWGPDHHGYVPRMKAALQALGIEPDFFDVLIVQQVNLLSGGQPVKMSKRAGEFITLRDLMDEVGADCAKFFFLMRSTSAHLDFDLDLAKRQNDENPAYYVQYAHARIASLLRFAAERELVPASGPEAGQRLDAAEELSLVRKLAGFPELVRGAAAAREPHRVPAFLMETAAEFHRFYHVCRVVSDDLDRSRDRLLLCEATRQVLANGLGLLGVSAPDRMERSVEVAT
jgi:arginyl-tRNA synthetase